MKRHPWALALVLFLGLPRAVAQEPFSGGIGILGDSYSDEYQFYPPDRSAARNWMEILAATRRLNFGRFSVEGRGEPRNQGYEYNWARSDATTTEMIQTGQHVGLARQVARGEVALVWIFIGGNDFIHALHAPEPKAALDGLLPNVLANHRQALETILGASPNVRVVLVTVPDIRHLPEFDRPIRAGALERTTVDAYSRAVERFNAQLKARAATDKRVALVDMALAVKVGVWLSPKAVTLAGVRLDRTEPGNAIDRFFVADARHMGTIAQGFLAKLFVDAVNAKFGAGIAPLTDREIVEFAIGLAPESSPTIEEALARLSIKRHPAE